MILPIYLYGQPVLRQEADDVDENYPDLKKLVENMYETMYESDGVGLAAPQIGLPIRLIVIDADVLKDTFPELEGVKMTLVNPELDILTDSPTVSRSEGCLSLPGLSETWCATRRCASTGSTPTSWSTSRCLRDSSRESSNTNTTTSTESSTLTASRRYANS